MASQTMPDTNQAPPKTFFIKGDVVPIQMGYLCPYPYKDGDTYAVYLNKKTMLPERVYLASITNDMLDRTKVLEQMAKNAKYRLDTINEIIGQEYFAELVKKGAITNTEQSQPS